MSKKSTVFVLILLFLTVAATLIYAFAPRGEKLSLRTKDESNLEKIIKDREEDPDLSATIVFNGERLSFDAVNSVYYYSLNDGDKNAFNQRTKVLEEGIRFLIAGDIKEDMIAKAETLPMIIYSDFSYRRAELALTTLPLINITYDGDLDGDGADMHLYLYDNRKGVENRITESDGTIRYRGASTLFYPKKSLKINLLDKSGNKNHTSLLGMRVDEDWILYALYNDQDKVRDVFSQKLWYEGCAKDNSWGVTAGMEYKYTEVLLNGEYMGMYALGYPIDEKQLSLSGDYRKEALYKKQGWDSEEQLGMNVWGGFPGYECKTDNRLVSQGYTGEFGEWKNDKGDTKTDMSEWQLLFKYYYYLANNAHDSDKMLDLIDVNNAIDIYIFYNIIQGYDSVRDDLLKNTFIAVREKEKKLSVLYVPWDMDITWGNTWTADGDINFTLPDHYSPKDNFISLYGPLEQIILNGDTDIFNKVSKRYFELRDTAWSDENINLILDGYEADIFGSGAYIREAYRWPEATLRDPSDDLSGFRSYVLERFKAADSYYSGMNDFNGLSKYVLRTKAFTDFSTSWIFIELNDHSLMKDPDFLDLLNEAYVDGDQITENTHFIVGNIADGYSYHDDEPNDSFELGTGLGNFVLKRLETEDYFYDDSYTVCLNDLPAYDIRISKREPVYFGIFKDGRISMLSFSGYYEPTVDLDSFKDETLIKLAEDYLNGKGE